MGGLIITGYVLEPVRVGAANSPFTQTPDIVISDQGAFDTAYPTAETEPRTDYHVTIREDGRLHEATFMWTKNEVIRRFDYAGRDQRFQTLPGGPLDIVGTIAADSNTNRLTLSPLPASLVVATYPYRFSVGADSGSTFAVTFVDDDIDFTTIGASGTVEVALSTGNINWHTADLTSFEGQEVRWQRQEFFDFDVSDGNVGDIDDVILLNPLPATGQYPLIRIEYGEFLTPVEVANEGAFSADPTAGTVEWALDTGRLKFNSGDVSANTGKPIYYVGAVFDFTLTMPTSSVGTVTSPGTVSPDTEGSGLYFRVPSVPVQFPTTVFVDAFSALGKRGRVEVRRSDGQIQFSFIDQALYGGAAVTAVLGDLPIERGISLRLFRSPIDPEATNPDINDVSAFYESVGATLADPIIASNIVFLPAIPVSSLPIVATVSQGTGSFVGTLPRLDVVSPPAGLGFVLDLDERQFIFAQRKEDEVFTQSVRRPYGAVALDPLLSEVELVLELEDPPGSSSFTTLPATINGQDIEAVPDLTSGLVQLSVVEGTLPAEGSVGSFSGTTFTDTTQDFTAAGVVQGDFLLVLSGGPDVEGVYTVDTVGTTSLTTDLPPASPGTNLLYEIRSGKEVLADRYFAEIPPVDPNTKVERLLNLGAASNSPRLSVDLAFVEPDLRVRFRFGSDTFSTTVTTVVDDLSFTVPASLAQGEVEISLDTGNANFSQDDVDAGLEVFWSRELILGTEYRLQPGLGFVEFVDRMLENEEAFITYVFINEDGERELVEERATFIVRKELTQDHPTATDTLFFNPLGREVAINPPVSVFRGGRPQVLGEQVTVNVTNSSISFLGSDQVTDALPSGSIVGPEERVYVDYFVHGAIGGEREFTVLQEPMAGVLIIIEDGETEFTIQGDRTAEFPANHLLRIDNEEAYLIGSSSYAAGAGPADPGLTTITLTSPQEFRSDYRNPSLAVSSGQTRASSFFLFPSYFITEVNSYITTPRGNNRFFISGDVSTIYETNTVVHWTDGSGIFDFNLVSGAVYDQTTNKTEVILTSNNARQYAPGTVTLKRSVRPVLETPSATVSTNRAPLLGQGYRVIRRVEGEVGVILVEPDDFTIGDSGQVTFTDPLQPNEELCIFYTGATVFYDGRDFRASYTHQIAPSDANGLLRQILTLDYTTYAPDTFYWRVETMTNFRAEVAEQYSDDATAGVPTGGPILENASQPSLFEEGRESVYYQERRLANEDLVARPTLKFFNDGINLLEDTLQAMDGRIVGDHDGRFLFDGLIDNPVRSTFADVTNQIDDIMKISDAPISITMPGFIITFLGTFQEVYKAAKFSRFYPTARTLYSPVVSPGAPGTGFETGDAIGDLGFKPLSQAKQIYRRQPWAVVTEAAASGATTVQVDTTEEAEELYRPAWQSGSFDHKVVIQDRDGTFIVPVTASLEVSGQTTTSLTFTAGVPSSVPVGATVYQVLFDLAPPTTPFLRFYRVNLDVAVNLETGELQHIQPFPPFDGNFGLPAELDISTLTGFPATGEVLDVPVAINNTLTSPDRFPALDGGTQDDDRNRQFPILGPDPDSEAGGGVGLLPQEKILVETSGTSGSIREITTDPFVGTGSLSLSESRITLDSGTFPAPAPKVGDLVRILSGLNAGLSFRRVDSTDGSTYVQVAGGDEWPNPDTAFSFTVTVSASLETGAAGTISSLTILSDGGATFITNGVQPGHTVSFLTGPNAGLRRQVVSIGGEGILTTDPWPSNGVGAYVVDDAFQTFGGTNSRLDSLETILNDELAVLSTNPDSQQTSLEDFLDHVFLDITSGTNGETTVGGSTFTDTTVDFTTAGIVLATDYIYMRTGASRGIFKLDPAGAITATTLPIVDDTFPATASGLSYRIVRPESMSKNGLQTLFAELDDLDSVIADVNAFLTLITTTVSVLGDAGAFAHAILPSDFDARITEIDARVADVEDAANGPAAQITGVLANIDRLYDRRYTWIDARINQKTGILVKKDRAVQNRLDQQEETLKQLTKLLTT